MQFINYFIFFYQRVSVWIVQVSAGWMELN